MYQIISRIYLAGSEIKLILNNYSLPLNIAS